MGGRGSSGKRSGGAIASKPAYFGETEKAVRLRMTVRDYDLETSKSRMFWVPKSQLADDGRPGEWITGQKAQEFYSRQRSLSQFSATWQDANGKTFPASSTAKEIAQSAQRTAKFQAGVRSYNDLIAKAKLMGIKGVCSGMKRSTIEKKIREHGGQNGR